MATGYDAPDGGWGDVPELHQPSRWQFQQVGHLVHWDDGCDPKGNFNGHCIIHDADKHEELSAEWNFDRGVMRCFRSPSCHDPKRAVSIVNAIKLAKEASA